MDSQLRRGLLEALVLKVLSYGDSYGYQIVKDVSPYLEITESTLYPILRRLENVGKLTVYSVEHNGRLRKYYRITNLGHEGIQLFVQEWKEVTEIYEFIKRGKRNE